MDTSCKLYKYSLFSSGEEKKMHFCLILHNRRCSASVTFFPLIFKEEARLGMVKVKVKVDERKQQKYKELEEDVEEEGYVKDLGFT